MCQLWPGNELSEMLNLPNARWGRGLAEGIVEGLRLGLVTAEFFKQGDYDGHFGASLWKGFSAEEGCLEHGDHVLFDVTVMDEFDVEYLCCPFFPYHGLHPLGQVDALLGWVKRCRCLASQELKHHLRRKPQVMSTP